MHISKNKIRQLRATDIYSALQAYVLHNDYNITITFFLKRS